MQENDINTRRYKALMATGVLLPILLYPFFTILFLSPKQDFYSLILYSRFIIWAIVGIIFLFARYGEVQPFLLWPNQQYKLSHYFGSFFILYLLAIASGIVATIPKWLGVQESGVMLLKLQVLMKQHPVLLVFGSVTAGITEELIFRGYIISRLSLLIKNKYVPVIISACLFAMMHLNYKSIREIIFAFSIGIVYGFYYQKYRNIYLLIIAHSIVDLIAFSVYSLYHK